MLHLIKQHSLTLSLRAASISSTFAKYVFHIWLKGWVFHRMTFNLSCLGGND